MHEFTGEVPSAPLHGHILVADDSDDNRVLLEHYLQMMNFKVDLATDGKSAVEMALSHDYDAVLMDVQMPEMDGFEAMHELRAKHYPKPVIAVTAHAMKGDKEHCLEEGFDDYLAKPIERETLRRTLAKYSANYH